MVSPAEGARATPLPHLPGAESVIVDPASGLEDDRAIAQAWIDFEVYLLGGLDDAWVDRRPWRTNSVVATSRMHSLHLVLDDQGRVHVLVTPRQDLADHDRPVAIRTLAAASSRVFEKLSWRWSLRQRCGPFETAPWRPARARGRAA